MAARARETEFARGGPIHPGEKLEEYLRANALSQAEFARRADLTRKLVNTIVKGLNPIEAGTAIALERVTGTEAAVWIGLQKDWDLDRCRAAERSQRDSNAIRDWLARFPVRELQQRGVLPASDDLHALREGLLGFLGVANEDAATGLIERSAFRYRASRICRSSIECVHVWLQLAIRSASEMEVADFSSAKLLGSLGEIRALTKRPPQESRLRLTALCAAAGVAVVSIPPFEATKLNGAAFRYAGNKAVVALSLQPDTNDNFWFTLFHELGHVCLHDLDIPYVDDEGADSDRAAAEAEAWAEDTLFGRGHLRAFMAGRPLRRAEVDDFAASVDVHPGIVVGMLQRYGVLSRTLMNDLKDRFAWGGPGSRDDAGPDAPLPGTPIPERHV